MMAVISKSCICFFIPSLGPHYIRPKPYCSAALPSAFYNWHSVIMINWWKRSRRTCRTICHVPSNASVIRVLSKELKDQLAYRHTSSLSVYDDTRAHYELNVVRSIRRKLNSAKLVLRETDKSGVFPHRLKRGTTRERQSNIEQKTGAYVELSENPLPDILAKVTRLLNDLRSKKTHHGQKSITRRWCPIERKWSYPTCILFPKAHKVSILSFSSFIDTYSFRKTHHFVRSWTQSKHPRLVSLQFSTALFDHYLTSIPDQRLLSTDPIWFVDFMITLPMVTYTNQLNCALLILLIFTLCYHKRNH